MKLDATIDLDRIHEPNLVAGISSLAVLLKFARHERYRHIYPHMPSEEEFSGVVEGNKIRLSYVGTKTKAKQEKEDGNEVLNRLSFACYGDWRLGFGVPPGYTRELTSQRIYRTGLADKFFKTAFLPSKKAASRKTMSVHATSWRNKVIKWGKEHEMGFNFQEALGSEANAAGVARTIKSNPWAQVRKGPKDVGGVISLPPTELDTMGGLHPLYISWLNKEADEVGHEALGIEDPYLWKLLLKLAPMSYIPVLYADGIMGVCPNPGTLEGFMEAYEGYQNASFCYHRIMASPETAAGVMARHLYLPHGHSYHVLYIPWGGKDPKIRSFFYQHEEKLDGVHQAMLDLSDNLTASGSMRAVFSMPLRQTSKKEALLSVYDQVRENIQMDRPWFRGLWQFTTMIDLDKIYLKSLTAFINRIEEDMKDKMYEKYGEKDVKSLRLLGAKIKKGMFHFHFNRGRPTEVAGNMARDELLKVHFRGVHTQQKLLSVLHTLSGRTGLNIAEEDMNTIYNMETKDAVSILATGVLTYVPRVDKIKAQKDEAAKLAEAARAPEASEEPPGEISLDELDLDDDSDD